MSKHSIWWFASGEYKKLSPSANSTLSSTEWEQDIKTTPNKTSTRLYGTKIKWKNYPLAITNNSTIFAHIILSYFSTPCPLSTRLGAFSFPRNIFPKIFSEIFFTKAKATFFWIFGAKNYGGRRLLALPKWGGWSLFVCSPYSHRLYITNRHSLTPASLRSPQTLHRSEFPAWKGRKQVKSKHLFAWFCLTSGKSETETVKILRYFWKWGKANGLKSGRLPAFWRVHLGVCAGFLMLRTYTSAGACPLVVCSLVLVRSLALCLVHCLWIWLYFAF